jgi:hypothetical protein
MNRIYRCQIKEISPKNAHSQEANHKIVKSLNQFLDKYLDKLPHHEGTDLRYKTGSLKRKYWTALILCWNDRYGSSGVKPSPVSFYLKEKKNGELENVKTQVRYTPFASSGIHIKRNLNILKLKINETILIQGTEYKKIHDRHFFGQIPANIQKYFYRLVKAIKKQLTGIRKVLAQRGDTDRLQMQRPLLGRSLLSVTTCRSAKYNSGLRALYTLAIHPEYGIKGYKVKSMQSFPFKLPKKLQDKLPLLTSKSVNQDVIVNAPRLTSFVDTIYKVKEGKLQDPDITTFLENTQLNNPDVWSMLGKTPHRFNINKHGFVIKVPCVKIGDCILWSEYHATAGSADDLQGSKITSFVDYVPAELLSPEQLIYWRYHCRHARLDVGGGSGRGTWGDFVHQVMSKVNDFGMPKIYMQNFQRTCTQIKNSRRQIKLLSNNQRKHLTNNGYIVLHTPKDLNQKTHPQRIIRDLSSFFRHNTLVPKYKFDFNQSKYIEMATNRSIAKQKRKNPYFFYTPRLVKFHELNPIKLKTKSHNAQGGGSLLTKDSGLARGTSYFGQRQHCAFQCSSFVFHALNTFYMVSENNQRSLLVVPERFRAKYKSTWAGGTHIDTFPVNHIPPKLLRRLTLKIPQRLISEETINLDYSTDETETDLPLVHSYNKPLSSGAYLEHLTEAMLPNRPLITT